MARIVPLKKPLDDTGLPSRQSDQPTPPTRPAVDAGRDTLIRSVAHVLDSLQAILDADQADQADLLQAFPQFRAVMLLHDAWLGGVTAGEIQAARRAGGARLVYQAAYTGLSRVYGVPVGTYTTPAAAREACEKTFLRELPTAKIWWVPKPSPTGDSPDGPGPELEELMYENDGERFATGYTVIPLTVSLAYDKIADW